MSENSSDWQQVLLTWDVKAEQEKADFLEILYKFCEPKDHTYTGLYQSFCEAAPQILKRIVLQNFSTDSSSSNDTDSRRDPQQPICDV
jgi:hypothetical protein